MDDILILMKQLWLVWFLALFVGVILWAYWPTRRDAMQQHANIPFQDDQPSSDTKE